MGYIRRILKVVNLEQKLFLSNFLLFLSHSSFGQDITVQRGVTINAFPGFTVALSLIPIKNHGGGYA
jgi:hypothetical protein